MEILTIPVDQIDPGERLRPVDDDYAAMIGASMAQHGQHAPIAVLPQRKDGKWPLISGAHRLRGAQLAGLTQIAAIERAVSDLQAMLLEIDENLTRHELNPLDRAVFMAERKRIYEELYPETKAGAARWKGQSDKFVVLMKSFSEATSEKLGVSPRSVERAVSRANMIVPSVRARIAGSWIARRGAHLDAIARLDAAEQSAVVGQLLDQGVETVAEALRIVRQAPVARVDVPEADFQKLVRLFNRSDLTAQSRFRAWLANEARKASKLERVA